MKTILTIDCGNRAEACAQGLACAIFNAEEMDILDTGVGARYQGSNVNIVVDDEDFEKANPKEIFSALSKAMGFVIKASKEGFDGNSPEEMLEIFSYPDEGTGFYSNVNDKVDLTVDDLEFLQKELTSAISEKVDEAINNKKRGFSTMKKMNIDEAMSVIKEAGLTAKPVKKLAAGDLEGFFADLNVVLERVGFDTVEDYDEFEEELNDMGSTHLFNVASDDQYEDWEEEHDGDEGYAEHYFKVADRVCKRINRLLGANWAGYSLDSDKDDTQIFVTLSVDGMGDEE